jgi:hypothetical protein
VVGPSSVLRMETLVPPKRLVTIYRTTRYRNPGDNNVRMKSAEFGFTSIADDWAVFHSCTFAGKGKTDSSLI